jgi:hypothetical protein
VRQRGAGNEVADGVDPGSRRAHRAVDLDQAIFVQLNPGRIEAERCDVGAAAGGDDDPVGLLPFVEGGGLHVDALPLEGA